MGRNPNAVCEVCDEEFYKRPKDKKKTKHDFCSRECMALHRSDRYSGDGNPNYKGKVQLKCAICGDEYSVKPSIVQKSKYCSVECRHESVSEYMSGENHYDWKGGVKNYYGPNWNGQRQKRLENDNYKCVVCGIENSDHKEKDGKGLHVHHIQPIRKFEDENGEVDYDSANSINNLVTLCRECHQKWEGVPVSPQ